ncbi:MAG: DUF5722 domain-containing protein [Candidatus Sumerlaeota bacterium]|nr:DUF5722 domain-containing protein [Candidatus Sumerlaeota bacterium]
MSSHGRCGRLVLGIAWWSLCAWNGNAGKAPRAIAGVQATADAIRIRVGDVPAADIALAEMPIYETWRPDAKMAFVWQGKPAGGAIEIPRFDGPRDRIYSRFQLVDPATRRAIGAAHFVDEVSALPTPDFHFPWPKSVKGLSDAPAGHVEDLIALGVKYLKTNVELSSMFAWKDDQPAEPFEMDGRTFRMNANYFQGLDAQFKPLADAGINVMTVVLNRVRPDLKDNPLRHPNTDVDGAPNKLAGFNLTDEPGLLYYRAALEYFARRYSDPSGAHGWVAGYIIGNEMQAHWEWTNYGAMPAGEVARNYSDAMRVAWLAVRKYHREARVYVSMCHWWHAMHRDDPLRAIAGDDLLEKINDYVRAEGDFPWQAAFHPYPENLFECRFWNDRMAVMGLDTPIISFKNLEVLPAFLAQERFLCQGQPRHIILSEQGFHCPDGPDAEQVQAAAFADSWIKVSHMPTIDAYQLSRYVDHAKEGKLRFGLYEGDPADPNPSKPKRKRLLYDVYRVADTPEWEKAFAFALPVIGLRSWDEALPSTAPIPAASGCWAPRPDPAKIVYDLKTNMNQARTEADRQHWRGLIAEDAEGRFAPAILEHPSTANGGVVDSTYSIDLPATPGGQFLAMEFSTGFRAPSANGARFAVLADGKEVWAETQKDMDPVERVVDLTPFAGKKINLTLRVDGLGDTRWDQALWFSPVIARETQIPAPKPPAPSPKKKPRAPAPEQRQDL